MDTYYFFKEILRGKNIGRALLAANLKSLFQQQPWLDHQFSVLEVGGERASHQRTYPKSWKLSTSNYTDTGDINYIFDANNAFPFADAFFDGTVYFNVLYALEHYETCIGESLRVSKKFVLFNIALIGNIAAHPTDFNRFTHDKLRSVLATLNTVYKFDYTIIPVGGPFSSAVYLIHTYLKFRFITVPLYAAAVWCDILSSKTKSYSPLQYIVLLKKENS